MTTIGLCMIVKNEAPVIGRCLASVRPLLDYALVVDTGSDDGTQALVRDYLARERLPGEVAEEPWRDFAHNRNAALARLRERPEIDYALVMDADDRLVFDPGCDAARVKGSLEKDFYYLESRMGPIRFWRAHILRNSLGFAYRGVLHEIVAGPRGAASTGAVAGLHIECGADGWRSRNPDKFRADAAVLEKALETETDEFLRARYMFYLGQSWLGAGEKEKALQAYLRRAELGQWKDEVCLSLYAAAQLMPALGHPEAEVIGTFLKAYEADPRRAEPLHGAMEYCRRLQKPHQGYLIGKHALTLPEPTGALFVASWIYDYGLLEEFSVHAFRAGHIEESLRALERLLSEGKIPEVALPRLRQNAEVARESLRTAAGAADRDPKSREARASPSMA